MAKKLFTVRHIIAMAAWMMFSCGLAVVVNAEKIESVNGGGLTVYHNEIAVYAANFPTGARGTVAVPSHYTDLPDHIAAKVVCLRVEGNQAWITAVPMLPMPDDLVIVLAVQDNGHSGDIATPWYTRAVDQGVSNPSEICDVAPENGIFPLTYDYLTAGDIAIHR